MLQAQTKSLNATDLGHLYSWSESDVCWVPHNFDYDAFGTLLAPPATLTTSYLFTGEQWDADLRMYFLRARYLNTRISRFWSTDQFEGENAEPLSLHKYLYVSGSPTNFVDLSGLKALDPLTRARIGLAVHDRIGRNFITSGAEAGRQRFANYTKISKILQISANANDLPYDVELNLKPDLTDAGRYIPQPNDNGRFVFEIKPVKPFALGVTELMEYLAVFNRFGDNKSWGAGNFNDYRVLDTDFSLPRFGVEIHVNQAGLGVITYSVIGGEPDPVGELVPSRVPSPATLSPLAMILIMIGWAGTQTGPLILIPAAL